MWTLWQWSVRQDAWLFLVTVTEERRKITLRGYKRRNPKGTVFRWRPEGAAAPKRFRRRVAKEKE